MSNLFDQVGRDLIMRPTEREPGIYEYDDGSAVMVAKHSDGKVYELLFVPAGEGKGECQAGDLLFEGVHIRGSMTEYDPNDAVIVESVELNPYDFV
jgi:hypothetical protein